MRKLGVVLVFMLSVNAMGAVNFHAADAGDGVISIGYTTTDGDLPVGFALKVEIEGDGVVSFADAQEAAESAMNAGFNTFIDWAYSNPVDFAIGEGHPLAKVGEAGALEANAGACVISMGVLDEDGDDIKGEAGPASADPMIMIPLEGYPPITVTISADTMRGPASGVVGQDGEIESNLPITIPGNPPTCYDKFLQPGYEKQKAEYDKYLAAGRTHEEMECWCCPYQCYGDVNCSHETFFGFQIYTKDIATVVSNWKAKIDTADPCADIDHLEETFFKYRVYTKDIAMIVQYWKSIKSDFIETCPLPDNHRE